MHEVETWYWDRINGQPAIWTRSAGSIEKEEYQNFYKAVSKDYTDPLEWSHFKAEGEIEFKSILFIPQNAPPRMYDDYYTSPASLRLYVRKVLISDKFEDLIPRYLNFVKGVVDSDDLPLNVNRETLQEHTILKVIGKKLVRKVLDMLRKLSVKADDEEGDDDLYLKFWSNFGKSIKMGVLEDQANKNKLTKLLRYASTESKTDLTSLDAYTQRMPDWQTKVFYIAGGDMDELLASPFVEQAVARGVEVLLMTDPLDEYVSSQMGSFDGRRLQSITKEGVLFGDETETQAKLTKFYKGQLSGLTDWLESVYTTKVEKVTVGSGNTHIPALVTTSQYGHSANMERLMKAQSMGSGNSNPSQSRKIMEINPRHPIIQALLERMDQGTNYGMEAEDLALLLLDTAMLSSGFEMYEPKQFSVRMYRLMQEGLGLDSLDLLPEAQVPLEEEKIDKTLEEEKIDKTLEDEDELDLDAMEDEL